jgi:predicted RNA-binding Zn ribbon-like protein
VADPLDLDPGPYPGTYKLIGGTPALDFANLVSYRGLDRAHDWLEPAANARRWAAALGLAAPRRAELPRLRRFREVLARSFLAIADGAVPARSDLEGIEREVVGVWRKRRLSFPGEGTAAWWIDERASLVGELALDAASLLTSEEALSRISACPECRWLFLDRTRNRSRRWCDPADCGNRARQRRHYRRSRV